MRPSINLYWKAIGLWTMDGLPGWIGAIVKKLMQKLFSCEQTMSALVEYVIRVIF